jgi:hypothetical protein
MIVSAFSRGVTAAPWAKRRGGDKLKAIKTRRRVKAGNAIKRQENARPFIRRFRGIIQVTSLIPEFPNVYIFKKIPGTKNKYSFHSV